MDSVEFQEVPTAWETDSDLRFNVEAEGSGLEYILMQSRRPGEPGFTDRRSKRCTNYNSCSWSFDHQESRTRDYEYRFRVYAGSDRENSQRQTVTYYENIDYSVSWVSSPPDTASAGDEVGMSLSAYDSPGRFDDEGILKLQYRSDSGNWRTFDSRRCSTTTDEDRCSNWGETQLTSDKIQNSEADFRGKIVFDGGVYTTSSTKIISISGETGGEEHVDSVNIKDLDNTAQLDSSFDIWAEAYGNELDRIIIQERDTGEPGWTDWRSYGCSGDYCRFSRSYSVDDTGEKEFRARAWAGSDTRNSGTERVDFVDTPRINDVKIDDLPSSHPENSDLDISGDADGNRLSRLRLMMRRDGAIDWTEIREVDCDQAESCDITENNFEASRPGEITFQVWAYAGSERRDSQMELVEFTREEDEEEERVDDVNLDNLESEHPTNEDLYITGNADGENLDKIILQKRDPGDDWDRVTSQGCGNDNSCDFSHDYSQGAEEEVDFRLKAEAGDDSETSNRETVDFQDDADDDEGHVDDADIDTLSSDHPVGDSLDVSGDASGDMLDRIEIQYRDEGDSNWNELDGKDCNNDDSCSISDSYTSDSEDDIEFRVKAYAGDDEESSGTETVSFYEEAQDIEEVSSVELDNLPSSYETETDLELSGEADGNNLDSLTLQGRREGSISIFNIKSVSCSGDSCSIGKDDFQTSRTGEITFRIRARAGSDTEYSNLEVVEFYHSPDPAVDSVSISSLPSSHPVGDGLEVGGSADGTSLDRIVIEYRDQGSSSWSEFRSRSCSGDSCSISRTYTSGGSETLEFRIKAYADGDSSTSSTETVSFTSVTTPSVDSVSIDDLPSTYETGSDLQITGDASGTDLENIQVEKRTGGSWSDVKFQSCSGSSCSISTTFSTSNTRDVDFRIRAEAGTDSGTSSTETVTFSQPASQPRVGSVNIGNLPDQHPVDTGLQVNGDASGVQLDTIYIERRPSSGGSWTQLESESCSGSSCSISTTFSSSSTAEHDFRVRATAGQDSGTSGTEAVEFMQQENIVSVELGNLPSSYPVRTDLAISGSASGVKIDSLTLMRRYEGTINWEDIETTSCNNQGSCSLNVPDYRSDKSAETVFKLRAEAGDLTEYSGMKVVGFTPLESQETIDTVDLEAPDKANTSENVWINGSAAGQNLDEIFIQREAGLSWSNLKQQDCGGANSCSVDLSYSSSVSGDQEFRAKVYAGSDSEDSETETITFVAPSTPPEIQDVDINSLPSEHPTGESLEIRGTVEGSQIKRLRIQKRETGTAGWNTIRSKNCGGSDTCETSRVYSSSQEIKEDFRVIAFIENINSTSNIETVKFSEQDTRTGPNVDKVELEDLPSRYKSGKDLDISADASGNELDSLTIQRRQEGSISWRNIAEKACVSSSSCSLTAENYKGSGEVTFRARAVAGTDVEYSGLEVVDFYSKVEEEDDARLRVLVEDGDSDELEDVRVEASNGEDKVRWTDGDGEAILWLEPDEYTVEASKDGYDTEDEEIELEEDERRTLSLELEEDDEDDFSDEDLRIISVRHPSSVCSGEEFAVDVIVENSGDQDDSYAVWGSGAGGAESRVVDIDEGEVREVTLTFDGSGSTGVQEFTVYSENGDESSRTRSVDVEKCDQTQDVEARAPSGLTAEVTPGEVLAGKSYQVKGRVIGTSTPQEVEIRAGAKTREISSDRDGSYSAFLETESPGTHNLRITSSGFSRDRTVDVLPIAEITRVRAPRKVFEGESFQICAEISSQVEAKVILERNRRTVATKNGRGQVCFDVEAGDTGEYNYRFRALTYGTGSDAEKQVTVLPADKEFDTFPQKIATVSTEPGVAKVTIYNRRNSTTDYDIRVKDIDDRWISATAKSVVLPKGGRETVYFYFTPRNSGDYRPSIDIETGGEEVYSREIYISSADPGDRSQRGFLGSLIGSLGL